MDTCAILDILPDPCRPDVRENDQSASLSLLRDAEAKRLDVYLTRLVREEFAAHVDGVQREAEAGLAMIADDIAKIYATSAARLPQDIASDFAALQVAYAPNMADAKALLFPFMG